MIRKVLHILLPAERRAGCWLIAGNAAISMLDVAALAFLIFIARFYSGQYPLRHPAFLPVWLGDRSSLLLIGIFALFFLVKSLVAYLLLRGQYRFVYRVASRISEDKLVRYLEGAFTDYVKVDASVQIRRISQQPIEFCQYVLAGWQQLLTEGFLVILSVLAILWYDARLFLLLIVLLIPALSVLAALSRKRLRSVRKGIKTSSEKSLQHLREALSGYIESNLYGSIPFFSKRYGKSQSSLNAHLSDLQVLQGMPARLIEVFAVAGLFILIAFSRLTGHSEAAFFVSLGAFLAASYKIIPGVVRIFNIGGQIATYQFTVDDLWAEASRPKTLPAPVASPLTSIAFRKVGFTHAQGRTLKDLSFCLQSGQLVGVSGASGKGKTTIVNLLLGFLPVGEGDICVNGQPADREMLQSQWGRIAYVQQHPFLLHDEVLKNITLSDEGYHPERLQRAMGGAELLQPEKTGAQGPDWLTRIVAESGKNISGGQRQRIAFARALYKDADLLILDEPFSELDEQAEEGLLRYCRDLARQGKMVLLITHNPKSLTLCDRTLRLDENA